MSQKVFFLLFVAFIAPHLQQSPTQAPLAKTITPELLAQDAGAFLSYEGGFSAEEIIAKQSNFDAVHGEYVVGKTIRDGDMPGRSLSDPLFELKLLAYNCDAIVVATPTRKVSSLTRQHKFVFSDYELSVNGIYLDRTHQLAVGSTIVLSRPGGVVSIGNSKFRAIETEFPLFHLSNPYIFFLHLNADRGDFTINASDVYLVTGDKVSPGRLHSRVVPMQRSLDSFTSDIRQAINSDTRSSR